MYQWIIVAPRLHVVECSRQGHGDPGRKYSRYPQWAHQSDFHFSLHCLFSGGSCGCGDVGVFGSRSFVSQLPSSGGSGTSSLLVSHVPSPAAHPSTCSTYSHVNNQHLHNNASSYGPSTAVEAHVPSLASCHSLGRLTRAFIQVCILSVQKSCFLYIYFRVKCLCLSLYWCAFVCRVRCV